MKRSEMIKFLADAIEYHEWKGEPDEMADHILTFIEKQGMLPPPHTLEQEVVNNPTGDTISVINYDWEDEE